MDSLPHMDGFEDGYQRGYAAGQREMRERADRLEEALRSRPTIGGPAMTPLQTALREVLDSTRAGLIPGDRYHAGYVGVNWDKILSRVIARLVRDEAAIEAAARGAWEAREDLESVGDNRLPFEKDDQEVMDMARAALLAWAEKVEAAQ